MPLEQLLAMYGYESNPPRSEKAATTPSVSQNQTRQTYAAPVTVGESSNSDTCGSLEQPASGQGSFNQHHPATSTSSSTTRSEDPVTTSESNRLIPEGHWSFPTTVSQVTIEDDSEWDDEDDDDYEEGQESDGDEPADWKRMINIGLDYQAEIPDGLSCYDGVPAYENEDRILWEPANLEDSEIEQYLRQVKETSPDYGSPPEVTGMSGMPELTQALDTMIRDDEQALFLLLQCGYKSDEALRRRKMQPQKNSFFETMTPWSEEECRNFEEGLLLFSKDFHTIQVNKVQTRSVRELVHFYYLWKKTERHDNFVSQCRIEKKKYTLHPYTT